MILLNKIMPQGSPLKALTYKDKNGVSHPVKYVKNDKGVVMYDTLDYYEYSDIRIVAEHTYNGDIKADGTASTIKTAPRYSQTRWAVGMSGERYEDIVITAGATITYSGVGVGEDGSVSADSLGTTLSVRKAEYTKSYATIELNGKSITTEGVPVGREANKIILVEAMGVNGTHVLYSSIGAGGGSVSPSGNGQARFTFTSGSMVVDSSLLPSFGGTATYTRSFSEKTDVEKAFAVDDKGVVSAESRGTVTGNVRSVTIRADLVVSYTYPPSFGSGTLSSSVLSHDVIVTQASNSIRGYDAPFGRTISNPSEIPASGGSVSTATIGGTISQVRHFSSGAEETIYPTPTASTFNTISAESMGTSYNAHSHSVGTLVNTYTCNGVNGTASCMVYQAKNVISLSLSVSAGSLVVPARYNAGGDTLKVGNNVSGGATHSGVFSSGSEATNGVHYSVSDISYMWTSDKLYATLTTSNAASLDVKMVSRGTSYDEATRSATITRKTSATISFKAGFGGTGDGSKSAECTTSVTQSKNVITNISVSATGGSIAAPTGMSAGGETKGTTNSVSGSTSGVTLTFSSGSTTNSYSTYAASGYPYIGYSWSKSGNGFSISGGSSSTTDVTADNNKSTSSRTCDVTRTTTAYFKLSDTYNNGYSSTATATATATAQASQSAGSYSYGTWYAVVSAETTSGIAASGGRSKINGYGYRTYGWNGATSGVGTEYQAVSLSTNLGTLDNASIGSSSGSGSTYLNLGNNTSTSGRTATITAVCGTHSTTCTVSQSAGSKSYGSWTIYLLTSSGGTSSSAGVSAGKASVTITAGSRRLWTWNGVSGSGDYEYSNTKLSSNASYATLSTGEVSSGGTSTLSFASRGKETGEVRSAVVTASCSSNANVKSTITVYQQANRISYGDVSTFSIAQGNDFPASGVTLSTANAGSYLSPSGVSQTISYTSGETREGLVSYSWVSGSSTIIGSLGTSEKKRDLVSINALTCRASGEGSKYKDVNSGTRYYQQANVATYGAVSSPTIAQKNYFPASGVDLSTSNADTYFSVYNSSQTISFTSGETRAGSVTYSWVSGTVTKIASLGKTEKEADYVTINALTVRASGEGGKYTDKSTGTSYIQAANAITSKVWNNPVVSFSYDSNKFTFKGGTSSAPSVSATQSGVYTYTSGDKRDVKNVTFSYSYSEASPQTGFSLNAQGKVTAGENDTSNVRYYTVVARCTGVDSKQGSASVIFKQAENPLNGRNYVDLALPSGMLWARTNYGTTSNTARGTVATYSTMASYPANWGGSWKMPTLAEFLELKNNVKASSGTSTYTTFQSMNTMRATTINLYIGTTYHYWTSNTPAANYHYTFQVTSNDIVQSSKADSTVQMLRLCCPVTLPSD